MKALRILTIATLGITLLACGKKSDEAAKSASPTAGKGAAPAPGAPAAGAPAAAPAAEGPDKVVHAALDALKANKPGDLWALLPASYQKDVQDLVTLATSKLDQETVELSAKVLDKAMIVLDKQGDKLGLPITPEQKKMIVDGYALLKETKILEYATLSKLDVASYLNTQGPKLMTFGMNIAKTVAAEDYAEFQSDLNGIKVKVLKVEGDNAEIEVTDAKGKVETEKMTKVEGKWLPTEMTTEWKKGIEEAKAEITKGMDEMAKNKDQTKALLTQALDALTKAEGGDMSGVQGLMGMMGGF